MKRLWEKVTPYAQIGGYLIMLGTICGGIYTMVGFVRDAQGAIISVATLQKFKTDTELAIAVLQNESRDTNQKVNIIYRALIVRPHE